MAILDSANAKGFVLNNDDTSANAIDKNVEAITELPDREEDELLMAITTLESIHGTLTTESSNASEINEHLLNASSDAYKGIAISCPTLQLESQYFNPFVKNAPLRLTLLTLGRTIDSLKQRTTH